MMLDGRVGEMADAFTDRTDKQLSGHARKRRHQRRGVAAFEDLQPLARDRVVLEPFDADVDRPAAADAEPPERIVCQIVAHDHRVAGRDDARGRIGDRRLETAAGKRAFVVAILVDQHLRTLAPVGASAHAHHGGDRHALTGRLRLADRFEEPFGLTTIHDATMAQTARADN
jgi:hypothetical protein